MAIEIPLTRGRFALVDDVDAEWAMAQRWCVTNGYPARGVWAPHRRAIYMHREIAVRAGMIAGYDDPLVIDHINIVRLDNRRTNLRAVTVAENNANVRPRTPSGMLGVYEYRPGRWVAEAQRNGQRLRRHGFDSPEQAAAWRAAVVG